MLGFGASLPAARLLNSHQRTPWTCKNLRLCTHGGAMLGALPDTGEDTCLYSSITFRRRTSCVPRALGAIQGAIESSPGDAWDKGCSPRLGYTLQPLIAGEGVGPPGPPPQPPVSPHCLLPWGEIIAHVATRHDIISQRQGPLVSFCWRRPLGRTWCS